MKKITLKYIFGLMIFSALLMVGCGGGAQKVITSESPEAAVMRISNSWRASTESSPKVEVDANGNFVKQVRKAEEPNEEGENEGSGSENEAPNTYSHAITLRDLSGAKYSLYVLPNGIVKSDNQAEVKCHFIYKNGYLEMLFKLIFDENKWWLARQNRR